MNASGGTAATRKGRTRSTRPFTRSYAHPVPSAATASAAIAAGVDQRDGRERDDVLPGEVEGDDTEGDQPGRGRTGRGGEAPEGGGEPVAGPPPARAPGGGSGGDARRARTWHRRGVGLPGPAPDPAEDDQGGGARHDQHGQGGPQRPGEGGDPGHEQRSRDGARLVEGLVDREAASEADPAGRVGQQRGLRRAPDGLAGAFGEDQGAGEGQARAAEERGDGERRHADRLMP
ncbi:hypothetical protein GCM10009593_39360 [Microlunatus antarcticus]